MFSVTGVLCDRQSSYDDPWLLKPLHFTALLTCPVEAVLRLPSNRAPPSKESPLDSKQLSSHHEATTPHRLPWIMWINYSFNSMWWPCLSNIKLCWLSRRLIIELIEVLIKREQSIITSCVHRQRGSRSGLWIWCRYVEVGHPLLSDSWVSQTR